MALPQELSQGNQDKNSNDQNDKNSNNQNGNQEQHNSPNAQQQFRDQLATNFQEQWWPEEQTCIWWPEQHWTMPHLASSESESEDLQMGDLGNMSDEAKSAISTLQDWFDLLTADDAPLNVAEIPQVSSIHSDTDGKANVSEICSRHGVHEEDQWQALVEMNISGFAHSASGP